MAGRVVALLELLGARLFVFAQAAPTVSFDAKHAARADQEWTKLSGEAARGVAPDDARLDVKWNLGKNQLAIEGFEMLKGLEGVRTHQHREWIPIVPNDQDMTRLAGVVRERLTP